MKYAAAEKGEREVRRYRVTQITTAQLGTFALYDVMGDGGSTPTGEVHRVPVPAWGLWTVEVAIYRDRELLDDRARVEHDAGALVLQSGGLIPADSLGGFRGVRFGDFVSGILDESRFDDPSREIETSLKHAPDEQA